MTPWNTINKNGSLRFSDFPIGMKLDHVHLYWNLFKPNVYLEYRHAFRLLKEPTEQETGNQRRK